MDLLIMKLRFLVSKSYLQKNENNLYFPHNKADFR